MLLAEPGGEPDRLDDAPSDVRPFRQPTEVPVVYALIDPLAWEDDELVLKGLQCVTVQSNLGITEAVSVSLSSRDPDGYLGMVFFDLTPADAVLMADELRRAAEDAVFCDSCGRTLATIGDYPDICPGPHQVATSDAGTILSS
jgi:hypothetical protein